MENEVVLNIVANELGDIRLELFPNITDEKEKLIVMYPLIVGALSLYINMLKNRTQNAMDVLQKMCDVANAQTLVGEIKGNSITFHLIDDIGDVRKDNCKN